jgi:glycosyltransferase involved in cell wall biosynthesis
MKIKVYIFSFNRGNYLQNCIRSLEDCAPDLPVTIIDDNSDDKNTLKVLQELSERYTIIRNDPIDMKEEKTGGLYGNMNLAMQEAKNNEYEYVLFIQDDMQMVRDFCEVDVQYIKSYFYSKKNSIQLVTTFIRTLSKDGFLKKYYLDHSKSAYIRKKEFEKGKSNFSAIGVFSVQRFFDLFEKFEIGEVVNSNKARNLGLVYGFYIYPFMNWLPYPISFRGKKRKLLHYLLEKIGNSGFYPIEKMTKEQQQAFFQRYPNEIPVMEKYLQSPTSPRSDVWSTGGGEYNIIARGGFPAKLLKIAKEIKGFID